MTTPTDSTYVPSILDDVLFLPEQDPHEPIWTSSEDIDHMMDVPDPNDQFSPPQPIEVRTAFGVIDFLTDVVEETHELLNAGSPVVPQRAPKLDAIRTRELGADEWRSRNETVTENRIQLMVKSDKRRKITITNYGPNVLWISNMSPQLGAGQPHQMRVPVSTATLYAPVVIASRDAVWGICAATQTADVDILEEFDMED